MAEPAWACSVSSPDSGVISVVVSKGGKATYHIASNSAYNVMSYLTYCLSTLERQEDVQQVAAVIWSLEDHVEFKRFHCNWP